MIGFYGKYFGYLSDVLTSPIPFLGAKLLIIIQLCKSLPAKKVIPFSYLYHTSTIPPPNENPTLLAHFL